MYLIYDSHAHIYPQKIAKKATNAIGDFYGVPGYIEGTSQNLLKEGSASGISKFLIHSVSTAAGQVRSINDYIYNKAQAHSEFIPFMTLHPDMSKEEIDQEVCAAINNGFKGIKLHPDFQRFAINGESAIKLYDVVDGRLPFLIHVGDKRYNYSNPLFFVEMAKKYPKTQFVGAHFGAWDCWDMGYDFYKGLDNVRFDTSSSLYALDPGYAVRRIRDLGAERFFFGTDFPMWNAKEEKERFLRLNLTETERENIFAKNLINFLNLKNR